MPDVSRGGGLEREQLHQMVCKGHFKTINML